MMHEITFYTYPKDVDVTVFRWGRMRRYNNVTFQSQARLVKFITKIHNKTYWAGVSIPLEFFAQTWTWQK